MYIVELIKKISINRVNKFDAVTKFRLLNGFVIAFGFSIIAPVLTHLYGEQLLPWAISFFLILNNLAVKTNSYILKKFSLDSLYKIGITILIMIIISYSLFFISPFLMIVVESLLSVLEVIIFGAYSIKLDQYIADNYPKSVKDFHVIRNSLKSDAVLLGLGISTLLSIFLGVKYVVVVSLIVLVLYTLWVIYNFNFYKSIDRDKCLG